jgi:hypothetical protein
MLINPEDIGWLQENGQDLDLKQNGEIEYENKNEQSTNHRIS